MPKTQVAPTLSRIETLHCQLYSDYLEREVDFDIYLPKNMDPATQYSLLLVNDGQDLVTMSFEGILNQLVESGEVEPIICVGIHCGPDRKMEYGTAYSPDFGGRGAKAGLYAKFIFDEMIPFLRKELKMPTFKDKSFAGFSLGALSALDLVWNQPNQFNRVGIFSGSLWWRKKAYDEGYDDEKDRLMHLQVRKSDFYPWLRFYLECGSLDETADRNKNGIIDSIDDTLDLIVELKAKGFTDDHIEYILIEGGKHDVNTWGQAFPGFLKWGFKKR